MVDDQISNKIRKWSELEGTEKKTFYREEIFDTVLNKFKKSKKGIDQPAYKVLISLVGFSPEPLILTIAALKMEYVLFLLTPETESQIDYIIEKTELKPSQYDKKRLKSSDINEIYKHIRDILTDHNPSDIAIDITGGKKIMGAGAAIAGAMRNCSMYYIDYKEYVPGSRTPLPGSEFLYKIPNPYEVFGDQDIIRALQLYKDGNFNAGIEILGLLSSKVRDIRKIDIYRAILSMSQAWEDFLFAKALKYAGKAIEKIQQFSVLTELNNGLIKKSKILSELIKENKIWLIINFYHLALTYAERKKYDFAVLMLYRTIEQIFSYRLENKYFIKSGLPEYDKYPGMLDQMNNILPTIYGNRAKKMAELPRKIGFMDSATILAVLSDNLLNNIQLKHLKSQADNRNKGVLAHGTTANNKNQFDAMNKLFRKIFERFIEIYMPDFCPDELLAQFDKIPLQFDN